MSSPAADRSDWLLEEGWVYLNHGSFGPSPRVVVEARERWTRRLESQPMRFLVREMEDLLDASRKTLAGFVGTSPDNIEFMDNATFGMNVAARTIPLGAGDQVLLTDHEYGAVMRIWRERCKETGAELVVRALPEPLSDPQELVDTFFEAVNEKTKVIVVSHVTSQTSAVFPVAEICREARRRKIPVCVDGPHAVAMVPVNLDAIDCDFYCASCHKWLCGPFGTGFLYVAPRWQQRVRPAIVSWGGSVSGREKHWRDEFVWLGTRDPAPFLAVADAVTYLEAAGVETFRTHSHALVKEARGRIEQLTGEAALLPDSEDWYGTMITLPLPGGGEEGHQHGRRDPLQTALWEDYQIELPVFSWKRRRFLRVSCHLYNTREDIDRLLDALGQLL